MEIDGFNVTIEYDPELEMFRGEFVGLNGGADFYAPDTEGLQQEGMTSLRVFLEACQRHGIEPRRPCSGKFNARIPAEIHAGGVTHRMSKTEPSGGGGKKESTPTWGLGS